MLDALGSLTARKRTVVVLRYYEDLEVNVIAELMGCAPSTVSSLLHRAMKDMKEILTHD
jgi:RNA polymerase sigma factor (sigma-70 family)